eukprot:g47754.t1
MKPNEINGREVQGDKLVCHCSVSGLLANSISPQMPFLHGLGQTCESSSKMEGMQVFVKPARGQTYILHVESKDSVRALKRQIQDREGIPPAQQQLLYQGKLLQDSSSLGQHGVRRNDTIRTLMALPGGLYSPTCPKCGKSMKWESRNHSATTTMTTGSCTDCPHSVSVEFLKVDNDPIPSPMGLLEQIEAHSRCLAYANRDFYEIS